VDVSFDTNEVRAHQQLDEKGVAKSPETKAGIRTLPLLPVLEHALREHRKEQLALGLASPDYLVFCSASGKPLDRHNVRNKGIVVAAEKAGLHREGSPTVTTQRPRGLERLEVL
jgi:hypothetical protein